MHQKGFLSFLLSLALLSSCMQAEKISLDTSGTEGLAIGGLSIELGLFGGGDAGCSGTCRIAVTSTPSNGNLGGISGADGICNSQYPGYKALLMSVVSGNVIRSTAVDWVLKPSMTYVRYSDDAAVGTTNAGAIFDVDLATAIGDEGQTAWMGFSSWEPAPINNCVGWSNATITFTGVAGYIDQTNVGEVFGSAFLACNGSHRLLCVQQ